MKKMIWPAVMLAAVLAMAGCREEISSNIPESESTGESEVTAAEQDTVSAEPESQSESVEETVSAEIPVILYLSNDNADGFVEEEVCISELDENLILEQLIAKGALPEGVAVNAFSQDGKELTLDMNQAFADYVNTMGTTGEFLTFGSVVNTFLTAYDAQSIMITAEGDVISTGHNIYEEPFGKLE